MSLQLVHEKLQEWKWVILAAHSALQGTLVCVLSGSSGLVCLTDSSASKVLKWIEESRSNQNLKAPVERVAELPVLLQRSHDANFMSEFGGEPVPPDAEVDADILQLHNLRNQFTHFRPALWSIEVTGLPRIIQVSTAYSQRVMLGHPACTYRLNDEQLELFVSRYNEVSSALMSHGAAGLPRLIKANDHLIRR